MLKVGKIVCEMPPAQNNPRNSEGAFLDLLDGRILFAYSHYTENSSEDGAPASIARCFSSDGGETWSDREIWIKPEEHDAQNLMSVSLLRLKNGEIGLFYVVKRGFMQDCRPYLRKSADEGKTWSEPICCISCPGYFVLNNDRVIQLDSGRLIFGASKHNVLEKGGINNKRFDDRGIVYFYFSDDNGETWQESKTISYLNVSHSTTGLQEPGLIALQNGVLWAWARTDMGRQYQMFSTDEGKTWTPSEPSVFSATCSPLSMKRIPNSGLLLAIWNPIPMYQTRKSIASGWGRTPLVGAVSADEGASWSNYFYVDNDKDAGYCYTAIHFTDNAVLLAYCAGGPEDGTSCLVRQRIKKIAFAEFMDYIDPLDGIEYDRKR